MTSCGPNNRIRYPAILLAVYYVLMTVDLFNIGSIGTLLRYIAILPAAACILSNRSGKYMVSRAVKWLFLFWLYSVATYLFSINQSYSGSSAMTITLNVFLILIIGNIYIFNRREILLLKAALITSGVITIAITLANANFSLHGRLSFNMGAGNVDQNYLNGYLMFTFVFCLMKGLRDKKIYLLAVLALLLFIMFTGSRGSLISFVIVFVVETIYILKTGQHLSARVLGGMCVGLVIVAIGLSYVVTLLPQSVSERFMLSYIGKHGTTGRLDIWKALFRVFKEDNLFRELFGHGIATTRLLSTGAGRGYKVAHNLWVDQLMSGGIVGVLLLVKMQFEFIRSAFRAKDYFVICAYVGFLAMCLSLSLTSYKPMWNCMMLILIIQNYQIHISAEVPKNELYRIQADQ